MKIRKEQLEETIQNTSIHNSEPVVKHIKLNKDKKETEKQIQKLKKFYGTDK